MGEETHMLQFEEGEKENKAPSLGGEHHEEIQEKHYSLQICLIRERSTLPKLSQRHQKIRNHNKETTVSQFFYNPKSIIRKGRKSNVARLNLYYPVLIKKHHG